MRACVWLVLGLSSCTVDADYGGTRFRCTDGRCPADQLCIAGFCEPTMPIVDAALADAALLDVAPGDGPAQDGLTADAGPPPCGKLGLIADNFDDGLRGPEWVEEAYSDPGVGLAETGGRLTITLVDGMAGSHWGAYESAHSADLRDSTLFVEAPAVPNGATGADMVFGAFVGPGNNNTVQFTAQQGRLFFVYRINDVETDVLDIPYNPSAHRWWQFREAGGMLYWETSTNGSGWTVRAMHATPIPLASARVVMAAGTDRAETAPGSAVFDNLNGGSAGSLRWCKTATLSDDFQDGVRGSAWARSFTSGGCTMSEGGGSAAMTPATMAASACAYVSSAMYDLTGSSAIIQTPEMLNATSNAYATFYLRTPGGPRVEFVQQGGQLGMNRVQVSGTMFTQLALIPYDPVMHRWLRLREVGGTTFWDTSPDGTNWMQRAGENVPFALSAVEVSFGAGSSLTSTTPGTARFDDYNR